MAKNSNKRGKRKDEFQNSTKKRGSTHGTRNSKGYSKSVDERYDNESHTNYGNDVSWYVPDITMLNDVAAIPFNYRTGDKMPLHQYAATSDDPEGYLVRPTTDVNSQILPGVVSVRYYPTLGSINGPADPVNVASTAVYSWIRHANSGSRNYFAPDLMLYLMAMDSIYTGIAFLTRVYATAMLYASQNKYLPLTLLQGMGINTTSIRGELLELNTRLNHIIMKASTLAVPATFPLYQRHMWMCSNVFTDEPNGWAQFYQFVPDALYRFSIDENTGGYLKAETWAAAGARTWQSYADQLDTMIDAIYDDEDAGLMSGDILKAYGSDKLFKLSVVPIGITIQPTYDKVVLHQIHNATPMGTAKVTSLNIIQRTHEISDEGEGLVGYLYCEPTFRALREAQSEILPIGQYCTDKLLDIHEADPTPAMVMEATRLMVGTCDFNVDPEDEYMEVVPKSCPTEIVSIVSVAYFKTAAGSSGIDYANYDGSLDIYRGYISEDTIDLLYNANQISYFPIMYAYNSENLSDNLGKTIFFGNTDRLTTITLNNIDKLNDVARLGLFDIPRLSLGQ